MINIDEKRLRSIYSRKMASLKKHPPLHGEYWSYEEFKNWYETQYSNSPKCHYCEIPENLIEQIYWKTRRTKRPATRTKLELERLDPFGNYNSENVVLACFNCNNCKSDLFSSDEFLKIGKEIQVVWQKIASENKLK
jgi:hypothetical protein